MQCNGAQQMVHNLLAQSWSGQKSTTLYIKIFKEEENIVIDILNKLFSNATQQQAVHCSVVVFII